MWASIYIILEEKNQEKKIKDITGVTEHVTQSIINIPISFV